MRRIIVCTVLILLLLNLTGCKNSFLPKPKEINDLQLVQVIGVDKLTDDPNDCMVTIASKNLEAGGERESSGNMGGGTNQNPGSSKLKALVLTSRGKTIFDAVRNMQTHSSKSIFWGHAEYYLIGEEAAKDDINKYIDFLIRDHELRIESKVYIVKGTTAKDLIEKFNLSGFFILDKLDSLGQNISLLSNSEEMPIHRLIRFIDVHHASARVPCIQLVNRDSETGMQIKDIDTCGYAIFGSFKLAGFIGTDISRGVNLITNTIDTSVVTIKDKTGKDVSLEIIDSDTKVVPYFNGDELEGILLKTKVTSNIGEVQSQTNFTDEDSIKHMASHQSEVLKNEMKSALEEVVKHRSDCLEICDRIRLSRPLKWYKIKDRWMQLFPSVPIDIKVESSIQRTYDIRDPIGNKVKE
jgi:spore germination protein KC